MSRFFEIAFAFLCIVLALFGIVGIIVAFSDPDIPLIGQLFLATCSLSWTTFCAWAAFEIFEL